jgi:hypothetical protein
MRTYKLSADPIQTPVCSELLFFFLFRLPMAALALGNMAISVVCVGIIFDSDSLSSVMGGLLSGVILL